MISEKWNEKFDVGSLQNHLNQYISCLEPVNLSYGFGGWTLLSANGTYKSGWNHENFFGNQFDEYDKFVEVYKTNKVKPSWEHVIPTQICHGYMKVVIEQINSFGLFPHRARIIRLRAHSASDWHRDAPDDIYKVRLHIPIVTNRFCFFEVDDEAEHFSADGSAYFVFVNKIHRVVNWGNQDRFHLVMDVKDTLGVTNYHKYDEFFKKKSQV